MTASPALPLPRRPPNTATSDNDSQPPRLCRAKPAARTGTKAGARLAQPGSPASSPSASHGASKRLSGMCVHAPHRASACVRVCGHGCVCTRVRVHVGACMHMRACALFTNAPPHPGLSPRKLPSSQGLVTLLPVCRGQPQLRAAGSPRPCCPCCTGDLSPL